MRCLTPIALSWLLLCGWLLAPTLARGAATKRLLHGGPSGNCELVSGGRFGRGQRLGLRGNNGGAYHAVVRVGQQRVSAVEKRLVAPQDTPATREVLDLLVQLNQAAAAKGLAPRFLGYRDVQRNGRTVRLLYSEHFGANQDTLQHQGKALTGHGSQWSEQMLRLAGRGSGRPSQQELWPDDNVRRLGIDRSTVVGGWAQYRAINQLHPDKHSGNMLWRIQRSTGGRAQVQVVGIDWDHPAYLQHAELPSTRERLRQTVREVQRFRPMPQLDGPTLLRTIEWRLQRVEAKMEQLRSQNRQWTASYGKLADYARSMKGYREALGQR